MPHRRSSAGTIRWFCRDDPLGRGLSCRRHRHRHIEMNAGGHRGLDSQCTQVNTFGASRLRSLQRIDEGEKIAPNLVLGKAFASDTEMHDAGAVVPKLDATALQLREHSGQIAHVTY